MYVPLSNTPGGALSLRKNPAPVLGTVEQYYLKHLFILFTEAVEGTIPVTRIRLYAEQIQECTPNRFQDIIMRSASFYFTETRKFQKRQSEHKNGKK